MDLPTQKTTQEIAQETVQPTPEKWQPTGGGAELDVLLMLQHQENHGEPWPGGVRTGNRGGDGSVEQAWVQQQQPWP